MKFFKDIFNDIENLENLHIKDCIKNLMVVMPSYFYKDIKYKTL